MNLPAARRRPVALPARVLRFVAAFGALALGYAALADSAVSRVVIETLTVQPAAALLAWLAPWTEAVALGPRLTSPAGGINVLNGCEGTDLLFLVIAALLAAPLSWRARAIGLLVGLALVFAVNQLRLIALFFAVRAAPAYFPALHGVVLPLLIVAIVALWFAWHLRRHATEETPAYSISRG